MTLKALLLINDASVYYVLTASILPSAIQSSNSHWLCALCSWFFYWYMKGVSMFSYGMLPERWNTFLRVPISQWGIFTTDHRMRIPIFVPTKLAFITWQPRPPSIDSIMLIHKHDSIIYSTILQVSAGANLVPGTCSSLLFRTCKLIQSTPMQTSSSPMLSLLFIIPTMRSGLTKQRSAHPKSILLSPVPTLLRFVRYDSNRDKHHS